VKLIEAQATLADASRSPQASALDCLVVIGGRHGLQLTVRQIVQDNALVSDDVSTAQLVHCARACGLKAKAVTLDWNGLTKLESALPAILRLKNGAFLILDSVEDNDGRSIAGRTRSSRSPSA
jgi:ATP-binding cassette subfamily B protein